MKFFERKIRVTISLPAFSEVLKKFKFELTRGDQFTKSFTKNKIFNDLAKIIVVYLIVHSLFVLFAIFKLEDLSLTPPEYIGFRAFVFDFFKVYFLPQSKPLLYEVLIFTPFAFLIFRWQAMARSYGGLLEQTKKLLISLIVISILLYLFSFVLSLSVSVIYANYQTVKIVESLSSPEKLSRIGSVSGNDIKEKLKTQKTFPKIIASDEKIVARIVANLSGAENATTFYTTYVLPLVSQKQKLGADKLAADVFYLPTNTLVVTQIDKNIFKEISPKLAEIAIRNYFPDKYLELKSELVLLSRQEYMKLREEEFNELIALLEDYINQTRRNISLLNSYIAEATNNIESNKQKIASSIQQRDDDYNYCKTAVSYYYFYGYYYPYRKYSDAYCDSVRAEWDSYISQLEANIKEWEGIRNSYYPQLSEEKEILDVLVFYKEFIEETKNRIPNELGIFKPEENKIRVVLDNPSSRAITDYFSTLMHEYLHASTYISDENYLDNFFEEGLTEYFSRQIIKRSTGEETALGYPALTKVMEKMVSDIPELKDIYFSKNQKRLEELVDGKYGKEFYEKNTLNFFLLSYVSGKEALKIANALMLKIGGEQLNEEDVTSRISEYVN